MKASQILWVQKQTFWKIEGGAAPTAPTLTRGLPQVVLPNFVNYACSHTVWEVDTEYQIEKVCGKLHNNELNGQFKSIN